MAATDPATLSATALLRLYRRKELSPVEATEACLDADRALERPGPRLLPRRRRGRAGGGSGIGGALAAWRALGPARRCARDHQGSGPDPRLDRAAWQPHHREPPAGRRRRPGHRHGCARPGRCCSAARPRPSSAGRPSPTTRSATSPATPGTLRARPAARAAAPPWPRRWGWGRCTSAPTAAARSASRPASAGSSA